MISEFLTDIAKGFNDKIEQVRFEKLEPGHLGRVNASGDRDGYRILIDREKLRCSFQTFFVLFHEIAHIELFHLGYRISLASDEYRREGREKEEQKKRKRRWHLEKSSGERYPAHAASPTSPSAIDHFSRASDRADGVGGLPGDCVALLLFRVHSFWSPLCR